MFSTGLGYYQVCIWYTPLYEYLQGELWKYLLSTCLSLVSCNNYMSFHMLARGVSQYYTRHSMIVFHLRLPGVSCRRQMSQLMIYVGGTPLLL